MMSDPFVGSEGLVSHALAEQARRRAVALDYAPLEEADLVMTDRGVGKIRQLVDGAAEVAFFASPGRPRELVERYPLAKLSRARLEPGRHCWMRRKDKWWPGHVVSGDGWHYTVRFPGMSKRVPAKDLFVRWSAGLSSPLPDLLARVTGDPAGLDARRDFLSAYFDQRRASRGLVGVTSTAAVMYAHQLEVARRILDDPVGRFLLADEVGLGKTVEALMVVRQTLVDDAEARVRIICPEPLVEQWVAELGAKIFVRPGLSDDFPFARVQVTSLTDTASWSEDDPPDLLVVDEAHNVASWASSTEREAKRLWRAAVSLTREVDRTLLLSATPSLHRDETYLALLHLLDPAKHELSDLAGFRRLLAMRGEIARDLIGLEREQDDPAFVTLDALEGLLRNLPEDAGGLRTEAETLCDALSEKEDVDSDGAARVEGLRAKVAEQYRLDSRMLRTRRDRTGEQYPVRGRRPADPVVIKNGAALSVASWMDGWRIAVLADHGPESEGAARIVRIFHELAWADPEALTALVAVRSGTGQGPVDLSPAEGVLMGDFPLGPAEQEELRVAPDVAGARAMFASGLADWVWEDFTSRDHVMLYTSSESMGEALLDALRNRVRPEEVGAVLKARPSPDNAADVERFSDSSQSGCHLLVCDSAAEEGLNLQAADILLLLNSPLDAGRVEQCVGRIDRHGSPSPVKVIPVVPTIERDGPWNWFDVLHRGYRVFDRSIAAFQTPIAELTNDFERLLYTSGVSALTERVDQVSSRLDEAVTEVRRSEVLDASSVTPEGRDLHDAVSAVDGDHDAIKRVTERYLSNSLRLFCRHHGDHRVSYWLENPFPGKQWQTHVDGSLIARYLADVVSAEAHVRVAAFDRSEALRLPGTRVLRAGDPLVDAVARMTLEQFDPGRVAARWRRLPRVPAGRDWVLLGFHFVIGPGEPPIPDDWTKLVTAAARRRVERFLPTSVHTVWVTGEGAVVEPDSDEAFFAEMPFDASMSGGDVALLGDAVRAIDELLPRPWSEAVNAGFEAALDAVSDALPDPALLEAATADAAGRAGIVSSRVTGDESKPELEQRMSSWILESLESATAVLDAVGVVVLTTGEAPPVGRSRPGDKQ